VAIQPDGKIVVTGFAQVNSSALVNVKTDFATARLLPNGSLDTTFGYGGKAAMAFTNNETKDGANALALQPDGKIVLAGYKQYNSSSDDDFGLVRLNADGSLDGTFGVQGKTGLNFDLGGTGYNDNVANAVAVQPDGKIVVAGSAQTDHDGSSDFATARFNSDGSLDTTFGFGTGEAVTSFAPADNGNRESASALVLQPDGKIVEAGTIQIDNGKDTVFAVCRLQGDGMRDGTFGGWALGEGAYPLSLLIGSNHDVAAALALQPDGKIVVAGTVPSGIFSGDQTFAVIRLNGDPLPLPAGPHAIVTPLAATDVGQTIGKRGTPQRIEVSFSGALDPTLAGNVSHYLFRIPVRGRKHRMRTVAVVSAAYNAATHAVTLTLGKLKSTDRHGTLLVQGLTDLAGDPLAAVAFAVNLKPGLRGVES
jgi:uncharacterized delta-60 repeat protein